MSLFRLGLIAAIGAAWLGASAVLRAFDGLPAGSAPIEDARSLIAGGAGR
jgi:hypothetical protein